MIVCHKVEKTLCSLSHSHIAKDDLFLLFGTLSLIIDYIEIDMLLVCVTRQKERKMIIKNEILVRDTAKIISL